MRKSVLANFNEFLQGSSRFLLLAHSENLINDEDLVLLYDLNTSRNIDLPYWSYKEFDLDTLSNDECRSEFRFLKNDIYHLAEILQIRNQVKCYNRIVADGIEALCIFLKRFAYPCRYADMLPRFARPVPQLCMISNEIMNFIYETQHHRLRSFDQLWLSPVRPVSRPGKHQRTIYNGHKRVHAIKFQSIVAPNGLIANLHGPVVGKRHDSGMLAESGLLGDLQQYSYSPDGQPLCVYGDPAYPISVHMQRSVSGPELTRIQKEYNTAMSRVRVSVEWVFVDIANYFAFVDFKKKLKIGLSAVGKM